VGNGRRQVPGISQVGDCSLVVVINCSEPVATPIPFNGSDLNLNGQSAGAYEWLESDVNLTFETGFLLEDPLFLELQDSGG